MPFTFLAHQAPVLPLKLLRPAHVSGTALVIGSMAPDFEYFIRGQPFSTISHTLVGQVVFCLPLTFLVGWLVRDLLGPLLGRFRPTTPILSVRYLACALAGSLSHVAWDGFTHGDGWA